MVAISPGDRRKGPLAVSAGAAQNMSAVLGALLPNVTVNSTNHIAVRHENCALQMMKKVVQKQ